MSEGCFACELIAATAVVPEVRGLVSDRDDPENRVVMPLRVRAESGAACAFTSGPRTACGILKSATGPGEYSRIYARQAR